MSDKTGIEWTDKTWNPWHGCTRVSPGCAHCYMMSHKERLGQNGEIVVRSKTLFNAPLRWKEPAMVFTCSWSDWFHETADEWRDEAWSVIARTPHLTYQILTKRPERVRGHLPIDWGDGYANVWLGVSVENQRWAERAAHLTTIKARVRFVSAEPLLGPVNLSHIIVNEGEDKQTMKRVNYPREVDALAGEYVTNMNIGYNCPKIDWVIVGGESGKGARPMDLAWARSLRDQCAAYGTAFFLKQLGGERNKRGHDDAILDGQRHTAMPLPNALSVHWASATEGEP